jgi:hypothetical protein
MYLDAVMDSEPDAEERSFHLGTRRSGRESHAKQPHVVLANRPRIERIVQTGLA